MAKKTQSFARQRYENLRALIAEVKVRKNLTDPKLAKLLGMGGSTFAYYKAHPGEFHFEEICMLIELAGRQDEVDQRGIL